MDAKFHADFKNVAFYGAYLEYSLTYDDFKAEMAPSFLKTSILGPFQPWNRYKSTMVNNGKKASHSNRKSDIMNTEI